MDGNEILEAFGKAMVSAARIPLHYGCKILFNMSKAEGIKMHGLHTLANGDRMVIEWTGDKDVPADPNWVYEVIIHPVKREEIDWENSCLLRK